MARIISDTILKHVSGRVGQFIIKQTKSGTVISLAPDKRNYKPNPRQKENNDKFKRAVAHAKELLKDPVIKKQYEKRAEKGQSAFNVAFSESMKCRED